MFVHNEIECLKTHFAFTLWLITKKLNKISLHLIRFVEKNNNKRIKCIDGNGLPFSLNQLNCERMFVGCFRMFHIFSVHPKQWNAKCNAFIQSTTVHFIDSFVEFNWNVCVCVVWWFGNDLRTVFIMIVQFVFLLLILQLPVLLSTPA